MLSRRQFIALTAMAAVGVAVPLELLSNAAPTFAFYQSAGLKKFAQPLRGVGPGGIPVALPDKKKAPVTGADHYSLNIGQFQDQLHPSLGPTTLWGYSPAVALGEGAFPTRHLGGIIIAQKGVPLQITATNLLPDKHILPVDNSNNAAAMMTGNFPDSAKKFGGTGYNGATIHLHGGFVPWISDGGPMAWFDPYGNYGPGTKSAAGNIYKLLIPNLKKG